MQIKQTPIAFFRAIGNIAWSAFRHPFKTTLIDFETGKIIGHYTKRELENQKPQAEVFPETKNRSV